VFRLLITAVVGIFAVLLPPSRTDLLCQSEPRPTGPPARQSAVVEPPRVVPVHLVPKDHQFDHRRLALNLAALEDVRAWYARALGGPTFVAEPFIVQRSRHTFAELADSNFQQWWPLLDQEFADYGMPWNRESGIKLLFLAQAAGAWAGADSENGGIESAAEAGGVPKGQLGGLVVIGDSSVGGVLSGACPLDGVQRGTAWWCNWDTYRGTVAHELGHTWGIPHPDAFKPRPNDSTPARWDCGVDGNTVMQCHWGFPDDSLLAYERKHFESLRYFRPVAGRGYALLADLPPTLLDGDVRIRRPVTAPARDAGDGVVWVDHPATGAATGYPWALVIASGQVGWSREVAGCGLVVVDLGREQGSGGRGQVFFQAGQRVVVERIVAAGRPERLAVEYCGPEPLVFRVEGERRFRAVLGNPRLYPRP
jgi:hypothetical protein